MVLEFREDVTKNTVVIIANERGKRPVVFGEKITCPFCKGAERATPPSKQSIPSEENWKVRVFDNVYALVKTESEYEPLTFAKSRTYAYGEHEVIVESDEHEKLYQDFTDDEAKMVFSAYKNRVAALEKNEKIQYVLLFKNHGKNAGASIEHEHAQLVSLPFVPAMMEHETKSFEEHRFQTGNCLYCDLIEKEKENTLIENDMFIAICPSFSRFAFETWILPKDHKRTMATFSEKEGEEFMKILRECVRRVHYVIKDYNIVFHNAVKGKDFHFHAEIYPRSGYWAGVELGAGVIVNQKSEKDALEILKGVK